MGISLSLYDGLIKALIDKIDMCSKILNCRTLPLISGYTMIDFLTTYFKGVDNLYVTMVLTYVNERNP